MILNENNGFYIGAIHYSPVFGKYYKSSNGICEEISQDEYNKVRDCGREVCQENKEYSIEEAMKIGEM